MGGLLKWVLVLLVGVLLVCGCVQQGGEQTQEQAKSACIALCEASEVDLSDGPCLSDDNPDWDIDDWVCDVAHSPREPVDNLPENQCQEFRNGEAHHFVEVTPQCEFIRAM
jgi:hypothetical protein